MEPLHIFKPGKHTAVNGVVIDFTADDLRAIADAYSPATHEAPLVIGHPQMDAPAYGWVAGLDFADGVLQAQPQQVEAQFAEMVNAGRFKKISASFYLPYAPCNPKPGVYYLRHVGFLGAAPPAVKGVKSASFAASEQGTIEFSRGFDSEEKKSKEANTGDFMDNEMNKGEAGDNTGPSVRREIKKLQDAGMSLVDISDALARLGDNASRSAGVLSAILNQEIQNPPDTLLQFLRRIKPPKESVNMSELMDAATKLKLAQAALEQQKAEFAEREKILRIAERAAATRETAEFVAGLVKSGQVLPRDQAGLVAYMAGPNEGGVIEFGEGDDKKSIKPQAWLREFLQALPAQVDFAERAGTEGVASRVANFAAPAGYTIDVERLELHNKARAWMAAHPDSSYESALAAVK